MCAEEEEAAGTGAAATSGAKWREEVEKAADLLIECYGAQALARARSVQSNSIVEPFAAAVTKAVERRLISTQ